MLKLIKKAQNKNFMVYLFHLPFFVWHSANLFIYFDKLQPFLVQFDPGMFTSWQRKEENLILIT